MQEKLYTVSEVAKEFQKSRQTIYNWMVSGRFPNNFEVGTGDGTITLIPASDVEKVKQEEADKLVKIINQLGFQCEVTPA